LENNLKVYTSGKFDVSSTASLSLFIYPKLFLVFAKNDQGITSQVHVYEIFDLDRISTYFEFDHLLKLDLPVKIYLHQPIFTLIPGNIFSQGKTGEYFNASGNFVEPPHFFNTYLKEEQIQILSFIPEKIIKVFDQYFSNFKLLHGSSSFLSYLIQEKHSQISQEIILNYADSYIYLAGFSNRELIVFNRFDIQSKEDALKYVLILIESLKFEKTQVRVTVYGANQESGITEDWGGYYFSNFRLARPYSNQRYSSGFNLDDPKGIFEFFWQCD